MEQLQESRGPPHDFSRDKLNFILNHYGCFQCFGKILRASAMQEMLWIEYDEMKEILIVSKPRNASLPVSTQLPIGDQRREGRDLHCIQKTQGDRASRRSDYYKLQYILSKHVKSYLRHDVKKWEKSWNSSEKSWKKKIHLKDWKISVGRSGEFVKQSSERGFRVDRSARKDCQNF